MRRKRIKLGYDSKELDRFYRILLNSKEPLRGRETIVLLSDTFSKIFWKINQIQLTNSMHYKRKYGDFSRIIMEIWNGKRFNQLGIKIPSYTLNFAINTTLSSLAIYPHLGNRVTLKTVYLSGFLVRTARMHEFDLKSELVYYDVPFI